MMRLTLTTLILVLSIFTVCANNLLAFESHCSKAQQIAADNAIDNLSNWQNIYAAYKKFHQCDDGYIAEGFSDSITHLLAIRWDSLKDLKKQVNIDKTFLEFVLKHIDSTTNIEDVQKVYDNANKHCPKSCIKLCSQIKERAKQTLNEIKEFDHK